jgi:hypothetical protein
MEKVSLSDRDLINHVYSSSVDIDKPSAITDWSTWHQWRKSTSELSSVAQMAYRVAMLHNQVENGGFIQYFDNRYGIYAYETLNDLKDIGATTAHTLLSEALTLINSKGYSGPRFFDFIYQREEDWDAVGDVLDKLDDIYYNLSEEQNVLTLLAKYLRKT